MNAKHTPIRLIVDECPDAHGFLTLRLADGTPNGDTTYAPVATVYQDHNAVHIVRCVNEREELLRALTNLVSMVERYKGHELRMEPLIQYFDAVDVLAREEG